MINWGTVATAVITALLVTSLIEYLIKPGLEARKEAQLDMMRTRRALRSAIMNLAMASHVIGTDLPASADFKLHQTFRDEHKRQHERMRAIVIDLFDQAGKYEQAFPRPYRDGETVAFIICLYGVMLSQRPRRRQAEIILELAQVAARVFDASMRRPQEWQSARDQLKALIAQAEN